MGKYVRHKKPVFLKAVETLPLTSEAGILPNMLMLKVNKREKCGPDFGVSTLTCTAFTSKADLSRECRRENPCATALWSFIWISLPSRNSGMPVAHKGKKPICFSLLDLGNKDEIISVEILCIQVFSKMS